MKKTVVILLLVGVVGCGGDSSPPAQTVDADPNIESESGSSPTFQDTVDDTLTQATETDPVAALEKLGTSLYIERNEEGEVTEVELFPNQITETNVTDAGLVHLKALTKLDGLDLTGTKVTDAELVHLKRLTSLKWLSISTGLTDTGVADLQKSLPDCEIKP